jgi:hypothetical protein
MPNEENSTNLTLSPFCIRLTLALTLNVLPTTLRRPLLGRCLRLDSEEPVEPSLLLAIQKFRKLVGAFAHAVFAEMSQNRL